LHEYDSRRAGQQGPIRTLTAERAQSVTNAFGGRAPPGPSRGNFSAPPDSLAAIGGRVLLLRESHCSWRRDREGERKGEGIGREGERDMKGRGLPPLYLTSGYGPAERSKRE